MTRTDPQAVIDSQDDPVAGIVRSPLRHLDRESVSAAARKESRNREVHLPPISTFRWWARRTESVNGALIDAFGRDHADQLVVADPFAGGGTIPLAAAIREHRVYAQDLNPWAVEGLAAMMALPSPEKLMDGREAVFKELRPFLDKAYRTQRLNDETKGWVSHTFRVATATCPACEHRMRLFPYGVVSLLERKERGETGCFLACQRGHLFKSRSDKVASCPTCAVEVDPSDRYTGRRWMTCPECKERTKLSTVAHQSDWGWEVVLVERVIDGERELALPQPADVNRAESDQWKRTRSLGDIPEGQETSVLLRHGFKTWNDIYPRRQQAVLERLLETIDEVLEGPTRDALRIAALGTVEMAGLMSRWDRWYLKSYEGMANHRFNFTTFAAEPNVWGCEVSGRGTFIRRINQLIRASEWLETETETRRHFDVQGPLASTSALTPIPEDVDVRVVGGSSERMILPDGAVDLVLTDPPYHDDVQYGELSLPFRAWAGQSVAYLEGEAVVNGSIGKNGADSYRRLLVRIFTEVHRTLKGDGHLIFSYANRDPGAWADVFWALQEAGFVACGYEILHSENETDLAKRGVRACTMDLILDLVPLDAEEIERWLPDGLTDGAETQFLHRVGSFFVRVGHLEGEWESEMEVELTATAFLSGS